MKKLFLPSPTVKPRELWLALEAATNVLVLAAFHGLWSGSCTGSLFLTGVVCIGCLLYTSDAADES